MYVEYEPGRASLARLVQWRAGETVSVEFLSTKPGEYEFACQMGMLRGKLVVE